MIERLWLIPFGFVIGAFGTLIGAGGGFVLMPILLLLYPDEAVDTVTSISLAVVFFNALSGSVAYGRMGRIDYRSGLLFAGASIPGAVLGALTTRYLPRQPFDVVFGTLMIASCAFLLFRGSATGVSGTGSGRNRVVRHFVDGNGSIHRYGYDMRIGIVMSAFVGFASSVLGIGGGIIHVPALVTLLNFPVHIATATSHLILAIMALAGTAVHVVTGSFSHGMRRTVLLSIGVLGGAQLGAWLSNRVRGRWIIRVLAAGLGLMGARLLVHAL